MYKQIIIVRKDLDMSSGKLAAQVSHASMAFLISQIREKAYKKMDKGYQRLPAFEMDNDGTKRPHLYRRADLQQWSIDAFRAGEKYFYIREYENYRLEKISKPEYHMEANIEFDTELFTEWLKGSFTKVILEAKNKGKLLKAVEMAESLGMKEGEDFFLIKDNCYTELTPEEEENGIGKTLTCIGFRPMDEDIINEVGKKYQIYH